MKAYIGDSVYAEFNGEYIILTTENGDGRMSNTIYLDQSTIEAFLMFVEKSRTIKEEP